MSFDNCKACTEKIVLKRDRSSSAKDIEEALENLSRLKKVSLAEDDLYMKRLSQCSECEYIDEKATCLQCGCFVEIRAKIRSSYCPHPAKKRW